MSLARGAAGGAAGGADPGLAVRDAAGGRLATGGGGAPPEIGGPGEALPTTGREAPPVTGGAATRPATSPERTTAPDPDLKTNHHQSRQPFRYIHTFIYNLCIFVVQKKPCWKIKRYHVPICISEPIQPFFLNGFSAAKIVKC